jgi:hypothetical protein
MKLKLHTYSNDDLYLKLECENNTEKDLIAFLIGTMSNDKKFEATGDSINGLFIKTNKKLR